MVLSVFKKQEKPISKESSAKRRAESYSSSEIRSGFLVAASCLALLGMLFFTGNYQLTAETYKVRILFNYISGLEKNAPVHFAGHEVGKVTEIQILEKDSAQVAVTAAIAKKAQLRKDSQAFIDIMGFMGEKFLELTPGSSQTPPLREGDTLSGTDPIALNELMKKGTDIADELQKTTVSLRGLIRDLDDTLGGSQSDIEAIFKNLNDSSKNLKEMTDDLKQHPWKLLRKGKDEKENGKKKRFLFF